MVPLSLADSPEVGKGVSASVIRAVVSGTFRRDTGQLQKDFVQLKSAGCAVLSPIDVTFVEERDGFVLAAHEVHEPPEVIERRHLDALEQADFVWLHAPNGYLGPSAAMELGVARALGVPVYARFAPRDVALLPLVHVVASPVEAMRQAVVRGNHTPSPPLKVLQGYYDRVARFRGYGSETAQDTLLLLTEEVGELARAIRKSVGLARADGYDGVDAAAELADVQLYVLHLANILDVDLADAVTAKERVNASRHRETRVA